MACLFRKVDTGGQGQVAVLVFVSLYDQRMSD